MAAVTVARMRPGVKTGAAHLKYRGPSGFGEFLELATGLGTLCSPRPSIGLPCRGQGTRKRKRKGVEANLMRACFVALGVIFLGRSVGREGLFLLGWA